MKRKYHRVRFTAAQSAELWELWMKGEGLHAIGRVLGRFLAFMRDAARSRRLLAGA
jgi:hypothetical protein